MSKRQRTYSSVVKRFGMVGDWKNWCASFVRRCTSYSACDDLTCLSVTDIFSVLGYLEETFR